MIPKEKIDFWIENSYNVMLIGYHGIGKTAIVKEAFQSHKLKAQYFSCSTLDPWVDLIGIPKEKVNSTGESQLAFVRPPWWKDVEAIFLDEYNRAPVKVKNAIMELIQFKSVNGMKFPKLRVIWTAINPDDKNHTYDVERLDLSHTDRFHIHYKLPYKLNLPYLRKKYGANTISKASSWWDEIPENLKLQVSPRRLDYALDLHAKGGDLRDCLPSDSNVSKLKRYLDAKSMEDVIKGLLKIKNKTKIKETLAEYGYSIYDKILEEWNTAYKLFLYFPDELIAAKSVKENKHYEVILDLLGYHYADKKELIFSLVKDRDNVFKKEMLDAIQYTIGRDHSFYQQVHDIDKSINVKADRTSTKAYSAFLSSCSKKLKSGKLSRVDRLNLCNDLAIKFPNKVSVSHAYATLKLLNELLTSYSLTSITSSFEEFYEIVGECVFAIIEENNWVMTNKNFDNLVQKISNELDKNNLLQKLIEFDLVKEID